MGEGAPRFRVERANYSLELSTNGREVVLTTPAGEHLLGINVLTAFDTTATVDETTAITVTRLDEQTLRIERISTAWTGAGMTLTAATDVIELDAWVEGRGTLTDVHLLGGRELMPDRVGGLSSSTSSWRTLFSPNPGDPRKTVRPAGEPAVIGVSGDAAGGRGHWFFTPAPLCLAFTTDDVDDPDDDAPSRWTTIAVADRVDRLQFAELTYRPADRAFHLVLDHDGHTTVDGRFDAPPLVITPGIDSPWDGLRSHVADLATRRAVPAVERDATPDWWREPMFCGWGAQCALAAQGLGPAPAHATEANYRAFLGTLEHHGVVPGTIVIDDKWQETYGINQPDVGKWPDLRGFIAARHDRGRRTLLWWKAWDPEGIPVDLCIRTLDGTPVAVDPTNPRARALLAEVITTMLGADGLAADGLKIDFTARTPTGRALHQHGTGWGIALLHDLLAVVYQAAKAANPQALIVTQTPHPGFADVTDMIRLNDILRLDDPGPYPDAAAVVRQMRHRAQVVAAALPETLIDTDDWAAPDLEAWRAYLAAKSALGVPALYYATRLDITGEALTPEDYRAVSEAWSDWRRFVAGPSGVPQGHDRSPSPARVGRSGPREGDVADRGGP